VIVKTRDPQRMPKRNFLKDPPTLQKDFCYIHELYFLNRYKAPLLSTLNIPQHLAIAFLLLYVSLGAKLLEEVYLFPERQLFLLFLF